MAGKNRFWHILVATLLAIQSALPAATLAAPTVVSKTQDLLFGKFAGGAGFSGSVRIDPSGARSASGAVVLVPSTFSPAGFSLTGHAGMTYTLSLPASFTLSSGADQMTVSDLSASIPSSGVLPVSGTLPFTVGGTLTVTGRQRNSTYSGTLDVTVK
jgi:hypothetical protein